MLGTVVEVRVDPSASARDAEFLDSVVTEEMTRLERVVSAFDPESELSRWKRGEVADPSAEFCAVMAAALGWQMRSGGAFNPCVGVLTTVWQRAEVLGQPPSTDELATLAESIRAPRFRIDSGGRPVPTGECADLNLNAFAKGWIVDRAIEAARATCAVGSITVNAGGDLAHRGEGSIVVGIENPLRPYDNEPSLATVSVSNGGLATSGRARRGFRIDGRWYAHVIDPLTGRTADHLASISVLAEDAATADVVATVIGLRTVDLAIEGAEAASVGCLVVDAAGVVMVNDRWRDRAR